MTSQNKFRIIQFATGNVGTCSLRAIIEHPQYELVGLWVNSPEKCGKEAAEICGIEAPTGILATHDFDEIAATDADCVLFMPQGTNMDQLCALLASGKNVVTTRGDFHYPSMMQPDVRQRIEAACKQGNTSIYSTGSSPGFVTEALLFPLVSLSRRLDCVTIDEFGDVGARNSPQLLFDIMGFGLPPSAFDQGKADYVKHDFALSLGQFADACGIVIDNWQASGEYSAASETIEIAAGTIAKGTVAAQRITISGISNGETRICFRANWYASEKIENTDWELRDSGWRIHIEGDTPMDVTIGFPVAPEDFAAFSPGLTAHRAVNAVLAVCNAPAGIVTTESLSQVIPHLAAA